MKKSPYMASKDFDDFMEVGAFVGEMKRIADATPEKEWARYLRTAAGFANKVVTARLECLADEQRGSVMRRAEHTHIQFVPSDLSRGQKNGLVVGKPTTVVISEDDLSLFIQVINYVLCQNCMEKNVKGCKLRKALHRACAIVSNDSPKTNECEFKKVKSIKLKEDKK